ncbi:hypothetical protein BJ912DRAFT_192185 [Pholiota molesta]|nr:hypothetical protein BJ912DRAFT_192185 [Pholiota molesta]
MPPFLWSQRDLAIVLTSAHVNDTSTSVVPNPSLIMAYNVLYILVPCSSRSFSRGVAVWENQRKELWFITLFSWWLASVNYVLLIGQQVGQDPNPGLCLVQAMLIYASPAFAAATTAAFMAQIYYTLDPSSSFHRTRVWSILLHLTPVLLFISIMMVVLLVGPILNSETMQEILQECIAISRRIMLACR